MTNLAHHVANPRLFGPRYRNPWPNAEPQGIGGLLRWMLFERLQNRRRRDGDPAAFPRATPHYVSPHAPSGALTATWVGHSTFLIQIGGRNILTDPHWSTRASPFSFAGPKRFTAPGVPFQALPPIDDVLLSHDHYDHLDDRTIRRLIARFPDIRWYVPLGVGRFLHVRGARHVTELDWWQERTDHGLQIACVPAQHFSGRGMTSRDSTLWCGWTVRAGGQALFFAGDTGRHPQFAAIAERYGPFQLALMPIGAYEPRWFMRPVHMDPDEAVAALTELVRANQGVHCTMAGMHWGTFKLADERIDEPPQLTRATWQRLAPAAELWIPAHGETWQAPTR